MNTALNNREMETANVGGARNGARQAALFGWDGQNGQDNGFPAAMGGESCCGEVLRPFWLEDGRFGAVCRKCGQKFTDNTQHAIWRFPVDWS